MKPITEFAPRPEIGKRGFKSRCRPCLAHLEKHRRRAHPVQVLWTAAKSRARMFGLAFNLTLADIVIPTTCPVLGIPLAQSEGKMSDNSPSLDRIVPEYGYVTGNVDVISMRANRLKNSATEDELNAILYYVRAHKPHGLAH